MVRPKRFHEQMPARFSAGTFDRIDAVLTAGETRADFLRDAVEQELAPREAGRSFVYESVAGKSVKRYLTEDESQARASGEIADGKIMFSPIKLSDMVRGAILAPKIDVSKQRAK